MSMELRGMDALLSKVNKVAKHEDIKRIVDMNTIEMTNKAIRGAPVDTGFLSRSIVPEVNGLTGRTRAEADYSAYVNYGTRFMASQPFLTSAFNFQKIQFIDDLKRLMK